MATSSSKKWFWLIGIMLAVVVLGQVIVKKLKWA